MEEIDVRDLMGSPGSSRTIRVEARIEGLRAGLAEVPEDAPVEGELLLESVVDGILVRGRLGGRMSFSCARCLKRFDRGFEVRVGELFAVGAAPDGDEYPLSPRGALDLEPMVRDAVILSMPFSPLCQPGCRGLCERCGGDRNAGECACPPEPRDPRWSALERFFG